MKDSTAAFILEFPPEISHQSIYESLITKLESITDDFIEGSIGDTEYNDLTSKIIQVQADMEVYLGCISSDEW